jgi:O-methyltransferase
MSGIRRRGRGLVRALVSRMGYDLVPRPKGAQPSVQTWPSDFEARDIDICQRVAPFTMTSPERIYALRRAVRYVAEHGIDGAIVECGVWRGGSMMAVAQTLLDLSKPTYDLYLFDTFDGMPPPTTEDRDFSGTAAADLLNRSTRDRDSEMWGWSSLEQTRSALYSIGYPHEHIHFVAGRVEDTIPARAPERIALLRLDTDWYASTRHELIHLFPRLVTGGVIIIDDYGHWQGAKKATDEYIAEHQISLLLNRIDYTGRIAVKVR